MVNFIPLACLIITELARQIKGVLPTDKDLASADALLKRAIDTDTSASRSVYPPLIRVGLGADELYLG